VGSISVIFGGVRVFHVVRLILVYAYVSLVAGPLHRLCSASLFFCCVHAASVKVKAKKNLLTLWWRYIYIYEIIDIVSIRGCVAINCGFQIWWLGLLHAMVTITVELLLDNESLTGFLLVFGRSLVFYYSVWLTPANQLQMHKVTAGSEPSLSFLASDPAGTHGQMSSKNFVFFLSLFLPIVKGGDGLFPLYRLVFTYHTLFHLRLHSSPPPQGLSRKYTHCTHHSQNATQHLVLIYTGTSVSAGRINYVSFRDLMRNADRTHTWKIHLLLSAYPLPRQCVFIKTVAQQRSIPRCPQRSAAQQRAIFRLSGAMWQ
jgi:hypothetical protein